MTSTLYASSRGFDSSEIEIAIGTRRLARDRRNTVWIVVVADGRLDRNYGWPRQLLRSNPALDYPVEVRSRFRQPIV